jgi:hypothetical protein
MRGVLGTVDEFAVESYGQIGPDPRNPDRVTSAAAAIAARAITGTSLRRIDDGTVPGPGNALVYEAPDRAETEVNTCR